MEAKVKRQGTKRAAKEKLELTKGEILFLWRRRFNLNQSKAAKLYECSIFNIKKAEYDNPPEGFTYWHTLGDIREHEKCVIYRRRSGLLQKQVAKKIGVSRYWINLQEKGEKDCTKLLAWWIALSD